MRLLGSPFRRHTPAMVSWGKLGRACFDVNIPVVDKRLRLAGVHLAGTLSEVFMKRTSCEADRHRQP